MDMKPAKKRLPAYERKKQILLSAVKVFSRSNYQAARVADIAAEAGISEAAVYKHFPSKKAVYLEILSHMSERIITFWQEEVDKKTDALEALRNMGLTYFNRMTRHPEEVRVQFKAIAEVNDEAIAERLRQDHKSYRDFVSKVLKKGIEQGRVRREVDVDALAWIFDAVGILMNMVKLLSLEKEFTRKKLSRIIDHMIGSIKVRG
jgi:AcrR family transcriptional regulator